MAICQGFYRGYHMEAENKQNLLNERHKIKCPFCGYEMPIFYGTSANAKDLHVRCKARHCRKFFEIKIAEK